MEAINTRDIPGFYQNNTAQALSIWRAICPQLHLLAGAGDLQAIHRRELNLRDRARADECKRGVRRFAQVQQSRLHIKRHVPRGGGERQRADERGK